MNVAEVNPQQNLHICRGTVLFSHLKVGATQFSNTEQIIKENLQKKGHKIDKVEAYEIEFKNKRYTF